MRILPCPARLLSGLALVLLPALVLRAGQPGAELAPIAEGFTPAAPARSLIDQLPEYLAERLPIFAPNGAVQISVHPHLGDFFHSDYVRVPVGVRWKATSNLSLNTELSSYLPRAAGTDAGLAGVTVGGRCDHVLPQLADGGFSVGLDYRTPFNHAPKNFSDGYRHVQPYVSITHSLSPRFGLVGYGNLAANFLEHTALPSNFGRNQLHANSLAVIGGVARSWRYFTASITARLASTALTSDEGRQNFQLRPEIGFPLRRDPEARTQILITLGGRVMWGPDGRQTNTSGGVRVNIHLDRDHHRPVVMEPHFAL